MLYVVCSSVDSSWDRSSPSLWSTSYVTSDSARSSPVTSPALRRRQHLPKPKPPPKPKPLPITGSRSLPEGGDPPGYFTTPSASPGSSSKGLDLFFRQMEKISKLGSDEQGRLFMTLHAFSSSPHCPALAVWTFVGFELNSAWEYTVSYCSYSASLPFVSVLY